MHTMLKKGHELCSGQRVTLLSGESGIATPDQSAVVYIVTDQKDKRGNPQIINLDTGTTAYATQHSVWNVT